MAMLEPRDWINLERVHCLLVDDHPEDASVMTQIVTGLGIRQLVQATSTGHAERLLKEQEFSLMLINANLRRTNAYELTNWLRRLDSPPNCYVPIILVAGHTPKAQVERGRDCGATVVLATPVSPNSMLERIIWASRDNRTFVRCDDYAGPDRRFQREGRPPRGLKGRRHDDNIE